MKKLGLVLLLLVLVPMAGAAAPIISNLNTELQPTFVKVSWETDVAADSQLDYGIGELNLHEARQLRTVGHLIYLTQITENTEYMFSATSCNDDGCASQDGSFTLVVPDTTPPVLTFGTVPSMTFNSTLDLVVTVSEESTIEVILNGNSTGNITGNGTFTVSIQLQDGQNTILLKATDGAGNKAEKSVSVKADPEPTLILETNLAALDYSSESAQVLKGKVSKPNVAITVDVSGKKFTGKANADGLFNINIILDTSLENGINGVEIFSKDTYGRIDLLVNGSISYVKCGSGSGYSTRLYDLTPDVIIPDHLMNGMAQFGFRMDFSYAGGGQNAYMQAEPSLTVQPQMSQEKRDRYDEELFSTSVAQCSEDRSQCYFLVNLAPWYGTRQQLSNRTWIKLPLMLRIQYTRELGGESKPEVQEQCMDFTLMVDKALMDFYKPNAMINKTINFINGTISVLDSVQAPIDLVKTATIWGCAGTAVYDLITRYTMIAACTSGKTEAEQAYYQGLKTCTEPDGCQSCLDSIWSVKKSEITRNWLCDRLFCPSVPTLEKHAQTYVDSLTKQESRCKVLGESNAACEQEYKDAWNTAGLFVDEWGMATDTLKSSALNDINKIVMESNSFCPAEKGFPGQIVRVNQQDYYIGPDDQGDVQVWQVVSILSADREGKKVTVAGAEYVISSEPLPSDQIPPQILQLMGDGSDKTKEYVFDPTAGPYEALTGGCLPALSGYISHWEQILGAVQQCLQMIQVNGTGTPGVCKAVLSQYVCDFIWDSVRCLGGGLTAGSQNGRFDLGILDAAAKVADAANSVSDSVSSRYGETAMFDTMFNQRKLIHGACLAFFTGDMASFDLNAMFSADVGMPVLASEGLVAPASRRFLTSNPFQQGWATFMYHVAYALNAGADLTYELKLVCSNDLSCADEGNTDTPGACDCFARGEQVTKSIATGSLTAGQFANEEKYVKITEGLRFDKAILEWTWTDNNGVQSTGRAVKKISVAGATPPNYCTFSSVFKEYRCQVILTGDGVAFFIGTPTAPTVAFQPGDVLKLQGEIGVEMPEGKTVPKALNVVVTDHKGQQVSQNTVFLQNTGTFKLEDFSELWPTVTAEPFGTECSKYDMNHPAKWDLIIALTKVKDNETGGLQADNEVLVYEDKPQFFRLSIPVACSGEGQAEPQCVNGAISSNTGVCWCQDSTSTKVVFNPLGTDASGKYCCNGYIATKACDQAAPKIRRISVRLYQKDIDETRLLRISKELNTLGNEELVLMPDNKVDFTEILVEDDSTVELKLLVDGVEVPAGSGAASDIKGFTWQPDMGGNDIKLVSIQFLARDATGLITRYPANPKTIKLQRTTLPVMS